MPSNTILKIAAVSLLVFSLVIGALLVLTIGERNVAQTALEGKTEQLQDKTEQLEEEAGKRKSAEVNFNGCQAALGKLNEATSLGQQEALASAAESSGRASAVLATLPEKIAQDRLAKASPAAANKWLEDLLK